MSQSCNRILLCAYGLPMQSSRAPAPRPHAAADRSGPDPSGAMPGPRPARHWHSVVQDFDWHLTGVRVRKTGAFVPFDAPHLSEVLHWGIYFAAVLMAPRPADGPVIGFAPDPARPWYLVWPALRLAGGRPARPGETPDIWMHFADETVAAPVTPPRTGRPTWNFAAGDLSKTAVAAAFEQAFGYPLRVDPRTHTGPMVEKGEANGVHDGRIVMGPVQPAPGKVYQRLVENVAPDGLMEDLRTPTLGGEPICVFIKRRPRAVRFSNDNSDCLLATPDSVFSARELAAIRRFCALLHLDWGGLDILRDAADGRLYIVDANRTDMGPPIALPLELKLEATRTLARALRAAAGAATGDPARWP